MTQKVNKKVPYKVLQNIKFRQGLYDKEWLE